MAFLGGEWPPANFGKPFEDEGAAVAILHAWSTKIMDGHENRALQGDGIELTFYLFSQSRGALVWPVEEWTASGKWPSYLCYAAAAHQQRAAAQQAIHKRVLFPFALRGYSIFELPNWIKVRRSQHHCHDSLVNSRLLKEANGK